MEWRDISRKVSIPHKLNLPALVLTCPCAEICPQLVFLKLNFDKYNKKAGEVREVFARYDERYEAVGCDEAFLNLTEVGEEHNIL